MDTLFPFLRSRSRVLFIDMNAFFASVEQQDRPELRNKPIAVAPVLTDNTCCIAASYEAKAYKIRTGTSVRDALKRCPSLVIVEARPELYLAYHRQIVEIVRQQFQTVKVLSVDEMACRLSPRCRSADEERAVAEQLRFEISTRLGPHMRCSIGVAPNIFLAKVASDRQKPDGLTIWDDGNLPDALFRVPLADLPGIGAAMMRRLREAGIEDTATLWEESEADLRRLWGSIVGARWWHMLRGSLELDYQPALQGTGPRKSVGHSNVLAPEYRSLAGCKEILLELIGKALKRLRAYRQVASGIRLTIEYRTTRGARRHESYVWERSSRRHLHANDDITWLKILLPLLQRAPDYAPTSLPYHVSVTFFRPPIGAG